jgi:hypothetical protein
VEEELDDEVVNELLAKDDDVNELDEVATEEFCVVDPEWSKLDVPESVTVVRLAFAEDVVLTPDEETVESFPPEGPVGSCGWVSSTLLASPRTKNTPTMATTTIREAIRIVKTMRRLFSQSRLFL